MREPQITINGVTLNDAQAMTIRSAITGFLVEMSSPGALGEDETGEGIRKGYQARSAEIVQLMISPPPPQANMRVALTEELATNEATALSGKPRLCLDHGDEVVAGHPSSFRDAGFTHESNQPDLAAELDGEVGSLDHAHPPLIEDESTEIAGDLLLKDTGSDTFPTQPKSETGA